MSTKTAPIQELSPPPVQEKSESGPPAKLRLSKGLLGYSSAVLLSIVILIPVLRLNKANLRIPLYELTDCYFYTALLKNVVAGHYYINPYLGAPGVQEMYDFALPHLTHWLLWKFLCLFTSNYAIVLNVFFVLTFPLMAAFSVLVFRQFGISYPSAVLGGLLYAFLPYHLARAEKHLTYSSYYLVPLSVMVLLWICRGEPLFRWDKPEDTSSRLISGRGIASVAICCLVAWDTPYQAFFSAYLLSVAGVLSCFRYGYRRLRTTAVLIGTLVVAFALNLAPNFAYHLSHGDNPEAVQRLTEEAEIYGLKMAQLVLPITGHRLHAFAQFKAHYNVRAQTYAVNENDWSSLGLIGSFGFLYLVAYLFFQCYRRNKNELLDQLSMLNLAAFLMGTIGGFGALFALFVSKNLRGYNRICVFIAFFSLFTAVISLDRLFNRAGSVGQKLIYPVVFVLLVLGLKDQTSKYYVPNHRQLQAGYASDETFFKQVQAAVPKGGMVFQLPFVPFPEGGGRYKMWDYDHMRGYLHTAQVRWSYGAMKGRDVSNWQGRVADMPPRDMAERLAFAGFSGIYINRDGLLDHGVQLEGQLRSVLHCDPIISPNQRLVFFSLANLRQQLEEEYSGPAWQLKHAAALTPLRSDL